MLKKHSGVSLLEAMLVLIIIGLVIMVAVRYFGNTNIAKNRAAAVAQMNTIFNASKAYINADGGSTTLLSGGGGVLVDANYLTKLEATNPWHGNINVCWGTSNCSGNDATTLQIIMYGLPASDCAAILDSLQNSTAGGSTKNHCATDGDADTLTVYYQLF